MHVTFADLLNHAITDATLARALLDDPALVLRGAGLEATPSFLAGIARLDIDTLLRMCEAFGDGAAAAAV